MDKLKIDFSNTKAGDYILVSTLSDWQKEYLNDNLPWDDNDRVDGVSSLRKNYTCIIKHEYRGKWYMAYKNGSYESKQIQFNDIVVEK